MGVTGLSRAPACGRRVRPSRPPGRLPRTPAPGTASISGIVLTDDTEARPLRRVRVFLNSPDDEVARTTISDDAGRFAFDGLRAGRYTVGGTKEGYVTVNYGARRPGGPVRRSRSPTGRRSPT